jgi:hypothetical protein
VGIAVGMVVGAAVGIAVGFAVGSAVGALHVPDPLMFLYGMDVSQKRSGQHPGLRLSSQYQFNRSHANVGVDVGVDVGVVGVVGGFSRQATGNESVALSVESTNQL